MKGLLWLCRHHALGELKPGLPGSKSGCSTLPGVPLSRNTPNFSPPNKNTGRVGLSPALQNNCQEAATLRHRRQGLNKLSSCRGPRSESCAGRIAPPAVGIHKSHSGAPATLVGRRLGTPTRPAQMTSHGCTRRKAVLPSGSSLIPSLSVHGDGNRLYPTTSLRRPRSSHRSSST